MALTADYNSSIQNQRALTSYTVAASQTFYAGGLVQLNASGLLTPLDATVTRKCVGQFVRLNSAGTVAEVREGDITLDNAASGDAIVVGNIGAVAYATDDSIVSDNSTDGGSPPVSRPTAGKIVGINAAGKVIVRCTLETTL